MAVFKQLTELDAGVDVVINGRPARMIAFAHAYIGDMVQQQWNAGFLGARARLGCRSCYISADHEYRRGDLEYDVFTEGRYHYQVMALREEMYSLLHDSRQQERFGNRLGMLVSKCISYSIHTEIDALTVM